MPLKEASELRDNIASVLRNTDWDKFAKEETLILGIEAKSELKRALKKADKMVASIRKLERLGG